MNRIPEWLIPEGPLEQEKIPQEGTPQGAPTVIVTETPLQPSYFVSGIPFAPGIAKLELDRDANHVIIRHAGYPLPPYPNLFSATLVWYWGSQSGIGGELRSGEQIILDGLWLKNTVLILQARTPAAGASAILINGEVYYW